MVSLKQYLKFILHTLSDTERDRIKTNFLINVRLNYSNVSLNTGMTPLFVSEPSRYNNTTHLKNYFLNITPLFGTAMAK